MPGGKKDRKRDRGGGSRGGLGTLGMFGVPEMPTTNDDELEAELLALTGEKKGSGKKSKGSEASLSLADIDKMVASVKDIGEDEEDEGSLSDIDDDELLAELQDLQEEDDEEEEEPPPPPPVATKPVQPVSAPKPSPLGSGPLQTVLSRQQMYESAITAAKAKGDSSKVRRYDRGLKTLQGMSRSLKAGKKVDMEDLPPEIATTGGSVAVGGASKPAGGQSVEEDDMAELQSWVTSQSAETKSQPPPAPSKPVAPPTNQSSHDVNTIQDRLQMYRDAIKSAEAQSDSSKARRYKRSVGTIEDMLKTAKTGRPVNMDNLPPPVKPVSEPPPKQAPPKQAPPTSTKPKPDNMLDLDAPEFDEFNISEEDMEAMMGSFLDDRKESKPIDPPIKATPTQATPTQKSVTSKPPSTRPPGLIDLDTPEFAEFDLSDADLEMLANTLVDDRNKDQSKPITQRPTQSLPVQHPPVQHKQQELTKELVLQVLGERKEQYMNASQKAKTQGDEKTRKQYGLVAVNFKRAIDSVSSGASVDLKGIPPPPPGFSSKYNVDISAFGAPTPKPHPLAATPTPQQQEEEASPVDDSIPTPKTPLEALTQRLDKYKEGIKSAQDKGESSRVRRTARIIKQYEDAIKLTKAGKPCDYTELPTPPGFPPIPSRPVGGARPAPPVGVKPQPQTTPSQSLPPMKLNRSVSDKQLQIIQQRGAEFLSVVKQANAKGDKDKAVTYLRYYKSIQQMQQAAQGGLPVDLTQLPPSPFADPTKATATKNVLSHLGPAKEGDDKTFDLIEQQLEQQMEVCRSNGELYQKLGNLAASSQHKNLADQCQRDLLAIKGIRSQNLAPPKFTMEMREFAIIHSHPEISDKQLEVEVIRGITLPAPSGYTEGDMNIYVEVEFPWPTDSPQKNTTKTIKDTSNPEYNETSLFDIDRKQGRSLLRAFKRYPIKCNVYQHRTLRKDIFVGVVLVPLESLETKCEIHVTEDLKDEKGRKPVGGKMEVQVRLREPLSGRDQEVKKQKWLVFQESIATEPTVKMLQPRAGSTGGPGGVTSPVKVEQTTSLEALKLELSIVQNAVKAGKKDPATIQRGQAIQGRMKSIKQKLQDPGFRREYTLTIAREMKTERVLEQQLVQAGRSGEAKVVQGRRKMMENELSKLQK